MDDNTRTPYEITDEGAIKLMAAILRGKGCEDVGDSQQLIMYCQQCPLHTCRGGDCPKVKDIDADVRDGGYRYYQYNDEYYTISEIAALIPGVSTQIVRNRLYHGWTVEQIIDEYNGKDDRNENKEISDVAGNNLRNVHGDGQVCRRNQQIR